MFDKEKFSKILIEIKKQYSDNTTYLANAVDMGRSYLSKYINKRMPAPPTPKILEKIAGASNGVTTYDELMQVCDYLDSNVSSKEILARNICRNYENEIDKLHIDNLDKNYIFDILINQNETDASISNQLSNFIQYNYGTNENTKILFDILTNIDQQIKNIITPSNMGIPLYSISKYPMCKISYFPLFEYSNNGNYIAVKAISDKMLPLLGLNDIAVIHTHESLIDGQTVLILIDNSFYDIAKIVSDGDVCKLYYSNSKYEEFELKRIKVIGEVVLCQNTSAFKKKGGD